MLPHRGGEEGPGPFSFPGYRPSGSGWSTAAEGGQRPTVGDETGREGAQGARDQKDPLPPDAMPGSVRDTPEREPVATP